MSTLYTKDSASSCDIHFTSIFLHRHSSLITTFFIGRNQSPPVRAIAPIVLPFYFYFDPFSIIELPAIISERNNFILQNDSKQIHPSNPTTIIITGHRNGLPVLLHNQTTPTNLRRSYQTTCRENDNITCFDEWTAETLCKGRLH